MEKNKCLFCKWEKKISYFVWKKNYYLQTGKKSYFLTLFYHEKRLTKNYNHTDCYDSFYKAYTRPITQACNT